MVRYTCMYKNLIFDLDGTLIDTVGDISFAINEALESIGLPQRFDLEGTKRLIGNGADMLVRRALLEEKDNEELFIKLKQAYGPRYKKYQDTNSFPYPKMVETLKELKRLGKRLFVVTNKPDELAKTILKHHFHDLFDYIQGDQAGTPLKPDPYSVNSLIEKNKLDKNETIYIGDSIVDIETGKNAGIAVILCLYGYGIYDAKTVSKADYSIDNPAQILSIVCE